MAKAQDLIAETLQGQYRNLHVALTVSQLRSIRIFVVGDVQHPGSYELSALASPMSALFAAGGPTAIGSLRLLRHFRNDKLVGEIDLYDFMLYGVRPGDDRLQGGDTLLVPPVGPQVAISGAVKRPAIYELKGEKDLGSVMEVAGGFTVAAALTSITIDRVIANQGREQIALPGADDPHAIAALLHSADIKDGDRIRVGTVLPRDERAVYVQGHVTRPGKIAFRDNMRINDVLRSYQDLLPEPGQHGEIVRLVAPDLHPETIDFDVFDLLAGNSTIPLQPFDTIRIFGRYEQDAPSVSIRGEVQRPGTYPLFRGMTAAQLVRTAGGFKRDALIDQADLASYQVINGTRVSVRRRDVAIGDAMLKGGSSADEPLKPGDVLTIHQLTGWNDIGASIVIEGEVAHPGSYGFQEGEHLSAVLRRAGGFRSTAYPEGAVLTRPEVAALEEKGRQELIRQIEASSAAARVSPSAGSEQAATVQILQRQQDDVLARLRGQPVTGRLVIDIGINIEDWAGTAADIEVRSGDLLRIPKRPGFVLVSGQAYSPSALTFIPGKTAGWYLQHAGGATSIANRKEIFVIRANGDVIGRRSGNWYERDVLSTRLNAGDTIVVPQKIVGPSVTWRNLLGTAQIATSLAIAAAVAGL
jgi:protein involved in polysaccharide export with SLBB domain